MFFADKMLWLIQGKYHILTDQEEQNQKEQKIFSNSNFIQNQEVQEKFGASVNFL